MAAIRRPCVVGMATMLAALGEAADARLAVYLEQTHYIIDASLLQWLPPVPSHSQQPASSRTCRSV